MIGSEYETADDKQATERYRRNNYCDPTHNKQLNLGKKFLWRCSILFQAKR